jgi:hypothetical protein
MSVRGTTLKSLSVTVLNARVPSREKVMVVTDPSKDRSEKFTNTIQTTATKIKATTPI